MTTIVAPVRTIAATLRLCRRAAISAADGALVHFDKSQPGDQRQQSAWSGRYALRVHEMARLLIRNYGVDRARCRSEVHRVENLADVTHPL